MREQLFDNDPRSYALELLDNGISAQDLFLCAIKYMSHEQVKDMLDCNELSPRFITDEEEAA